MTSIIQRASAIANEVYPRIYVGNIKAAQDSLWLRQHHITVVVNCTKDLEFCKTPNSGIQKQYRIPVDDNLEAEEIDNLTQWAPEAVSHIIADWRAGHTILIHCFAGMQRSAATAAMTIYVLHNYTDYKQAIQHVKSGRPIAFLPRANFRRSVESFAAYYDKTVRPLIAASGK